MSYIFYKNVTHYRLLHRLNHVTMFYCFTIQYDDAMRLLHPRLIMSCLVTIGYF